jgi:hypothetical protein
VDDSIGPDGRDLSNRYDRADWGRPFWANRRQLAGTGPEGGVRPVFTEIAKSSGLIAAHSGPGAAACFNPQFKGSGLAVFDADGDGWDDVFVPDYSARRLEGAGRPAAPHLFRNRGGMRFEDVTAGSGLDTDMLGTGVGVADVDGDGDRDLLLLGLGSFRLMRNEGRFRFTDVTAASGLSAPEWASSAAFFDYDQDGWLDVLILGYNSWSREDYARCVHGPADTCSGAAPSCLPPLRSRLFRGRRDGTFVDVSAAAGLSAYPTRGLGILVCDLEDDGRPDLFVADDGNRNHLFSNRGGGHFEEIATQTGVAYDEFGNFRAGMGVDGAYLFHDERLCFAVGVFEGEEVPVYCQGPAGPGADPRRFTDQARALGVGKETVNFVTFGVRFLDYDLDGWEDLLLANGHVGSVMIGRRGSPFQPLALYQNMAGQRLGAWILPEDTDFGRPLLARALATSDLDHDGDLDLVVSQSGGPVLLYRNDTPRAGRHSLVLRLTSREGNVNGVGAKVEVRCGTLYQRFYHSLRPSFMAASSEDLVVGLGTCAGPAEVTIRWPSGSSARFDGIDVDRALQLREGETHPVVLFDWDTRARGSGGGR